jgi:Cft2 family RNA processing exonuclease
MALPDYLSRSLYIHLKSCKKIRCNHLTPQLSQYRKYMKGYKNPLKEIVANAVDDVTSAIWDAAPCDFITQEKKTILDIEKELVAVLKDGGLDDPGRFEKFFDEQSDHTIIGVLWAGDFQFPDAQSLFRLTLGRGRSLAGFADAVIEAKQTRTDRPPKSVVSQNKKLKKQLAAKKTDYDTLAQQNKNLKTKVAQLKQGAAEGEQERKKLKTEHVGEKTQWTRGDADRRSEIREKTGALEKQTKQTQKERQRRKALEEDNTQLAAARDRAYEQLKEKNAKLLERSVELEEAQGASGVWDFLRQERSRIGDEKTIGSGEDRTRAEEAWTKHRVLEQKFLAAYPQFDRQGKPASQKPRSPVHFKALGGHDEVGQSCYFFEFGSQRLLVDCGIKPSDREDLHPDIEQLDQVDALLLTHAHTDHVGWVAALVKRFPDLNIYCTHATSQILPVILKDCRTHYLRKLRTQKRNNSFGANNDDDDEAYGEWDVHEVPSHLNAVGYREPKVLSGGVRATFYQAGHILGAASVLLEDDTGRTVFCSGDVSDFPQETIGPADWPTDREVDLLVLESTYGKRIHENFDAERTKLVRCLNETLDKSGSVILASFGLGRAQELLMLVKGALEEGNLPNNVRVYYDGMIRDINPIYAKFVGHFLINETNGFYAVEKQDDDPLGGVITRRDVCLQAKEGNCIIVTTSGMLAGGPVVTYADALLSDRRHRIVLTGYQDEAAPSRAIRDATKKSGSMQPLQLPDDKGDMKRIKVAQPAVEVKLSAHADQAGLVKLAQQVKPKHIVLVHGDDDAQSKLRPKLYQALPKAEITCGPDDYNLS